MAENRINCNLAIPYPSPKTADLNKYDAHMVRTLLSDKLCTINEYIAQSVVLAQGHGSLADIIDCIAVTETKHFKLLGRLLCLSGEQLDRKSLTSACRRQSGHVSGRQREDTALAFIGQNLESERMSASDIRLVLSQVNDMSTAEVLRRILADEEHHADIFANLKQRYS